MSQHYSSPKRADDPHALPDVEVFYVHAGTRLELCPGCNDSDTTPERIANVGRDAHAEHVGYYWQACFPGCLPDGEPNGPFDTEAEAIADAQSDAWQDDCESTECATCGDVNGCKHAPDWQDDDDTDIDDSDDDDTNDANGCPECSRSFGPHYRGNCEHGGDL